jgi:hypothetical protein
VTERGGVWLAGAGSVAAFVLAFFLRMRAAYGPLHLSLDPGDWTVLWELWRHGQIATRVVGEGVAVGAAAAAVPWALHGLTRRRRGR